MPLFAELVPAPVRAAARKRLLLHAALAVALGAMAGAALAQAPAAAPHDPATQMLPDARGAVPWSLLSATPIKMVKGKLGPEFPPALRALDGKAVKLQGYILPLEAGQSQRYFLLSAWSPSCPFCQSAGPEAMVEVKMRSTIKYSVDPVVVEGRLVLLDNDTSGMFYRLVDAAPAALP